MKTRYFTDGTSTWKFPPKGRPQFRYNDKREWEDSEYRSLAAFKASPGKVKEITEEEGEPS